jgi:hypothetical protein
MDKTLELILSASKTFDQSHVPQDILDKIIQKKIILFSFSYYESKEFWNCCIGLLKKVSEKENISFIGLEIDWKRASILNHPPPFIWENNEDHLNLLHFVKEYNENHKSKIYFFGIKPPVFEDSVEYLRNEITTLLAKYKNDLINLLEHKRFNELFQKILTYTNKSPKYFDLIHYSFYLLKKSNNDHYDQNYFIDLLDMLLDIYPENDDGKVIIFSDLNSNFELSLFDSILKNFGDFSTFHLGFLFYELSFHPGFHPSQAGSLESYCSQVSEMVGRNQFFFLFGDLEQGSPFYDFRSFKTFSSEGFKIQYIIPAEFFHGIVFYNSLSAESFRSSFLGHHSRIQNKGILDSR